MSESPGDVLDNVPVEELEMALNLSTADVDGQVFFSLVQHQLLCFADVERKAVVLAPAV